MHFELIITALNQNLMPHPENPDLFDRRQTIPGQQTFVGRTGHRHAIDKLSNRPLFSLDHQVTQ